MESCLSGVDPSPCISNPFPPSLAIVSGGPPQMPPDIARENRAISCNECRHQFEAPMHFVGYQCPNCHSYNTKER